VTGNHANGKFDLEAAAKAKAAASESQGAPFAFSYKGGDYEVPPSREWSMAALERLAGGDLSGALTELLGEETYGQLRDAGMTLGELEALFENVAQASGLETLPNSRPPARRVSTRT
jgi:hypothetical protein